MSGTVVGDDEADEDNALFSSFFSAGVSAGVSV
jgi:hypothetical protein